MDAHQQSDLAQQEAAARDYRPQLEGVMVGEKTSSHAITQEYAKADPTFVAKTLALPQTYSHYRPILGDGNCGWRAIAFAYFEVIVRSRDMTQLQSELARISSLTPYIQSALGYDDNQMELFEDFIGATTVVLKGLIGALSSGQDAEALLIAYFNNTETAPSVVYHLRLLASAWLKGNIDRFSPWIVGTVDEFIRNSIMPVDLEIDHLGAQLLFEALLKPAGIVLEIAYLDRSEGSEVNVHRMPEEANGQDPSVLGPIIYLLYRPGHYDILYRDVMAPAPPMPIAPTSIQVHRAAPFHQQAPVQSTFALPDYATMDMSALAMIPTLDVSTLASPTASSPMTDPYVSSPQSPWVPPFPEAIQSPSVMPPQQPSPPQRQSSSPAAMNNPLRFSKWNFPNLPEMAESINAGYEPTFTTNTFKNSHFNVAHYSNNNFQPEMYRPDADEPVTTGRSGTRKKGSEHHTGVKK